MKLKLALLLLSTLMFMGFLMSAVTVQAAEIIDQNGVCAQHPDATLCQDNKVEQGLNSNSIFGPSGILTKAAQIVAIITGVASVIMIISSGIQYAISSGDPSRLNRAKDTMLYAFIGLAVAMSAQAIIVFVLRRIG